MDSLADPRIFVWPKIPPAAFLPTLTDVWGPHVSFFFNLLPPSTFSPCAAHAAHLRTRTRRARRQPAPPPSERPPTPRPSPSPAWPCAPGPPGELADAQARRLGPCAVSGSHPRRRTKDTRLTSFLIMLRHLCCGGAIAEALPRRVRGVRPGREGHRMRRQGLPPHAPLPEAAAAGALAGGRCSRGILGHMKIRGSASGSKGIKDI